MPAKNTLYTNFYLQNEIEDQYLSHLNLNPFVTVDNSLTGTAGMQVKINRYSATDGAEKLAIGVGNTQSITTSFTPTPYNILLTQARFEFYDEEEMTDPIAIQTGIKHLATDMFNTVNTDIYNEYLGTRLNVNATTPDFAAFVDAFALMNIESLSPEGVFGFVNPAHVAAVRKALKDDLKYVEAFARNSYIGTVAGINLYAKKDAAAKKIVIATKEAVTLFNKKGMSVESVREGTRSETAANVRLNTIFARKYYVAALTDATKAVTITLP